MKKKKQPRKEEKQPTSADESFAISILRGILHFCLRHKWDFVVFTVVVAIALVVILPGGILTWPAGSEAAYYVKAAERIAAIWRILPGFLYNFLTDSYTLQDYTRMGFVNPSGTDTIFNVPCYATYLSFWVLFFGSSLKVWIASQLFLIGLIFVQVFALLRNYISQRASLCVTFLAMVYFPLYCGVVMTYAELFISLCLLLAFRLYLATCKSPSRKNLFWLGFTSAVLAGAKSSMMYIIVILFLVVTVTLVIKFRKKLKAVYGFFLLGVLIPMLLMFVLFSRTNGRYGFMESGAGGRNLYAGQQYITNCLYIEGGVYQDKWFIEEARKITNTFDHRRWFVEYSDATSRAFLKIFTNEFGGFLLHTIRKTYVLISYPPLNTMRYIQGYDFLQNNYPIAVHWILIALAFSALIIRRDILEEKVFLCGVFLYHIVIYGMSNIGTRYMLPLTPLYIVFAGMLLGSWKTLPVNRSLVTKLSLLMAAIITLCFLKFPAFGSDYFNVYAFKVILLAVLALIFGGFVINAIRKDRRWPEVVIASLILFYAFCCFASVLVTNKGLLNTSVKVKDEIEQEITLDGMFRTSDYQKFYLMFDPSLKTDVDKLTILVNGAKLTNPVFEKGSPVEYINVDNKTWVPNEPRWRFIELKPEMIKANNIIKFQSDEQFVFNADYSSKKVHYFPSYLYDIAGYNVVYGWKKTETIDKRASLEKKPASTSRTSHVDGNFSSKNLRVYILGRKKGGWCIPKQYEGLNRSHEFYLTLLRLTDRGIARYKSVLSAADVPAGRTVLKAVMGEIETFYSGYEFF